MLELVLLDGTERRFALEEGAELMVGVAANCAIRLTAVDVSRAHSLVTCQRGKLVVLDLGSTNGTFVNGRRIKEAELHAGDFIRFSSVMAQLTPPSDATRVTRDPASSGERAVNTTSPTGERRQSTSDRMPLILQESISWLLGRWALPGELATGALVEWVVQHRGLQGAAILDGEDGEVLVMAAHGDVVEVLEDPGLRRMLIDPMQRPEPFEAIEISPASRKALAVKATGLPWLLLVLSSSTPDSGELSLLVRLLAVARRLDRATDPAVSPRSKANRAT